MLLAATFHKKETVRTKQLSAFDKAVAQAGVLYSELKKVDFDAMLVDRSLLFLEDQSFAENQRMKSKDSPAFAVPYPGNNPAAWESQIAFYTEIFVKRNYVKSGDGGHINPEGSWIVCTRSGKIHTVPAKDLRWWKVSKETEPGRWIPVFPFMNEYSLGIEIK